ncbi:39S ribosomal protein L51, mitochondrial-like [Biomphalaria glabrata]|uniref:Large ribosomal subunit protein mL51 n=1 Tax=Biomphalaria glabrata TaxID=6526 RepID=A0A2C9JPZ2_BIOGL|nr:39S ribosomal protein L51, mitochondrial-like [Biomphalaria glabrata]XP_055863410.1 39S ribosomal protein L51, mitochondrial-like [Biomphalaria glabrata]
MFAVKYQNSNFLKSFISILTENNLCKQLPTLARFTHDASSSSTESSLTTYKKEKKFVSRDRTFEHATKSPYKTPGPRRYGHYIEYMTDGVLPRHERPVRSLPPYRPSDSWSTKKALFGQNDYIDILGDGTVHPADLLTGPRWLIAFKADERLRLLRQMEWEGNRLKLFYPSEYNRIQKRIRYLTKIYNFKRKSRSADGDMSL